MKTQLSTFLNFCTSNGHTRIGDVQEAAEVAASNDPHRVNQHDFYRQIRQALIDMHSKGVSDKVLDPFLHAQTDERRRRIYPSIIQGYRHFLAASGPKVTWWTPPATTWSCGELEIAVAPELGLNINGTPFLIALWFDGIRPSEARIKLHLNILSAVFGTTVPGAVMGILDVRLARLHALKQPNPRTHLLLRGEAAAFATIWKGL